MREEHDSLGTVQVPDEVLYGAQTQRALDQGFLSGRRLPRQAIATLAMIKKAAARAHEELGTLDPDRCAAIATAAGEVAEGIWDHHFPLDLLQTGSGTSSHMNANEVIARLAQRYAPALDPPIHANDDVNKGQSSNDVMPSVVRLVAYRGVTEQAVPGLSRLIDALRQAADRAGDRVKPARTHLMDAMPITWELAFQAAADRCATVREGLVSASRCLLVLPLGGTAVGNGHGAPAGFSERCFRQLRKISGLPVSPAARPLALQAGAEDLLRCSAALRTAAVALARIADDIRHAASGPRLGLADLRLPAHQPGSSFMPDKVNPVTEETVIQACYQILACDQAVLQGALGGYLELCTAQPLLLDQLDQACGLLGGAAERLARDSIERLEPLGNADERYADHPILCTALAGRIGYERAAAIGKQLREGTGTLRELAVEAGVDEADLDQLLDLERLARGRPAPEPAQPRG